MVSKERKAIDFWLGEIYKAEILGKGNIEATKKAFKNTIPKGSEIEKEARKRLEEVKALPRIMGRSRCFISDKHFQYLTDLLT